MPTLKPSEDGYWNRSCEAIVKVLPGERILTPDRMLIISRVEAFRGLVRETMNGDFHTGKEKKPGDVFVTQIRGFPLINVTLKTDGDEPEVVWLKKMVEGNREVSGFSLVKSIAVAEGKKVPDTKAVLTYAMKYIHGKNVQDPKSPIRIVDNIDHPLKSRFISFNPQGGSASNSTGEAGLDEQLNGITSIEQARDIISLEAQRLGVPIADILDPKKIAGNLKQSPLLRKVMKFFGGEQ